MKGRPPKANRLKELSGSRHVNHNEPQPAVAKPEMPYGLKTRHREAAKFWQEFAPIMARLGVLTEADAATWHLTALHYGIAVQAAQMLADDGLTRRDENGVERKHPALQILRDNSKLYMQYADRLGLSASARARLSVEVEDEGEAIEDLLAALVGRAQEAT